MRTDQNYVAGSYYVSERLWSTKLDPGAQSELIGICQIYRLVNSSPEAAHLRFASGISPGDIVVNRDSHVVLTRLC